MMPQGFQQQPPAHPRQHQSNQASGMMGMMPMQQVAMVSVNGGGMPANQMQGGGMQGMMQGGMQPLNGMMGQMQNMLGMQMGGHQMAQLQQAQQYPMMMGQQQNLPGMMHAQAAKFQVVQSQLMPASQPVQRQQQMIQIAEHQIGHQTMPNQQPSATASTGYIPSPADTRGPVTSAVELPSHLPWSQEERTVMATLQALEQKVIIQLKEEIYNLRTEIQKIDR